ncbi:MAG: CoA pyrophosphatase [Oligoflexales bacterium]
MRLQSISKEFNGKLPLISAPIYPDLSWSQDSVAKGSAAVAFLFIPPMIEESFCRLVLTKRSLTVGSHKGQVGFAGGRCDASDKDPAETAMREVEEEIGISRKNLTTHGYLESQTSINGSKVIPVLMTADVGDHDFSLNVEEVELLFLLPWNYFSVDRAEVFSFNMFGVWRESYLFDAVQTQVWGLTAHIIKLAGLKA